MVLVEEATVRVIAVELAFTVRKEEVEGLYPNSQSWQTLAYLMKNNKFSVYMFHYYYVELEVIHVKLLAITIWMHLKI